MHVQLSSCTALNQICVIQGLPIQIKNIFLFHEFSMNQTHVKLTLEAANCDSSIQLILLFFHIYEFPPVLKLNVKCNFSSSGIVKILLLTWGNWMFSYRSLFTIQLPDYWYSILSILSIWCFLKTRINLCQTSEKDLI